MRRAGVSQTEPRGGRFLAEVLEDLREIKAAGRGEYQTPATVMKSKRKCQSLVTSSPTKHRVGDDVRRLKLKTKSEKFESRDLVSYKDQSTPRIPCMAGRTPRSTRM